MFDANRRESVGNGYQVGYQAGHWAGFLDHRKASGLHAPQKDWGGHGTDHQGLNVDFIEVVWHG
jgi:hypothetical protein